MNLRIKDYQIGQEKYTEADFKEKSSASVYEKNTQFVVDFLVDNSQLPTESDKERNCIMTLIYENIYSDKYKKIIHFDLEYGHFENGTGIGVENVRCQRAERI